MSFRETIDSLNEFIINNEPPLVRVITSQTSLFPYFVMCKYMLKPGDKILVISDSIEGSVIQFGEDSTQIIDLQAFEAMKPDTRIVNFLEAVNFCERRKEFKFLVWKDPIGLSDTNNLIPGKRIKAYLERTFRKKQSDFTVLLVDNGGHIPVLENKIRNFELSDIPLSDKMLLRKNSPESIVIKQEFQDQTTCLPMGIDSEALVYSFTKNQDSIHDFMKENMRSEFFTLIENAPTMDEVAGLIGIKEFIQHHKLVFQNLERARAAKITPPRGILLTGIQGCGKSWVAKAIPTELKLPLFEFNISRILGGLVGKSENNMKLALKHLETIAPCMILMDEIDKQLGGVESSARSDGGTLLRVIGMLLTFLQESNADIFLVGTSNNFDALPAEFVSRMDAVFFVDLPSQEERQELIRLKVNGAGDATTIDFKQLSYIAGLTGREIDKAVNHAKVTTFNRGLQNGDDTLTTIDLHVALESMTKLSDTRKAELDTLRTRLKDVAKNANEPYYSKTVPVEKETTTVLGWRNRESSN